MKAYPIVILMVAVASGSWAFSKRPRPAESEPRFQGRNLSYWARVLTADQTRRPDLLLKIGPGIVPHLVKEIQRCNPGRTALRHQLNSFLLSIAPEKIRAHLPASLSQEERRLNGIILLGALGPDAKAGVPVLISLLDEENLAASGAVAITLGKIGPAAKDAVPKLIELLNDPSAEVATALGQIGPDAKAAVPTLTRVSMSGPLVLRRAAASAIQRIDPESSLRKIECSASARNES